MSLISRSCKNDHIIFIEGTPSLEARNIRLVNIITYIIEESKLIINNIDSGINDYETKSFVDNNKNIHIKGAHDAFLE
jgi:hypothetical protein